MLFSALPEENIFKQCPALYKYNWNQENPDVSIIEKL